MMKKGLDPCGGFRYDTLSKHKRSAIMVLQTVTLEAAATLFNVHPRTIVRALSGQHNTYWSEDINHDNYPIDAIARAYGMEPAVLRRVIEGRETLLRPDEAAELLGIRPRTFRERVSLGKDRLQKARVSSGGIVRYLKSKVTEAYIANLE
jgi:DNA-directed RNA polymerase specialized sigma24 family protein